jgi:chromosomal replication initiator protein
LALPAQPDAVSAWGTIQVQLRRELGDSTYEIWLASVTLESFDGRLLILRADPDRAQWIRGRFGAVLERCAARVLGPDIAVRFAGEEMPEAGIAPVSVGAIGLNPRYRFEQFIIGENNRLAHAAALAVAEWPGQAYNPLFLHAPPGLGKTHLLHAIGNYVASFGGGATVRYATAEEFTNQFLASLNSRTLDAFKRSYRDADVLLIDDVQFLAAKARTEEEFFHTFNAVYETGRQLVLTCDRLPRALVSVQQRLRERFEAGLVADISPPDHATRRAILRKRVELDGVELAEPGVLDLIAERVTENIRTLEGALIRVVAFHSLTRRPIDRALTREVLDTLYPVRRRAAPTIEDVKAAVARHYQLSVEQLESPTRTTQVAWPRQVAIHLARDLTGASLPAIGEAFHRNHSTVVHACKRVSERCQTDQQAVDEISILTALLSPDA